MSEWKHALEKGRPPETGHRTFNVTLHCAETRQSFSLSHKVAISIVRDDFSKVRTELITGFDKLLVAFQKNEAVKNE